MGDGEEAGGPTGRGGRAEGKGGVWGLEDSHPARPLLAGSVVFWLAGWLGKLGVRGGKGHPGTREGSLVRRQELVASRHELVASRQGLVACWGVEGVLDLCRSGLHPRCSPCSSRAGGDQVAWLATVAAQTSFRSATSFVEGEWASGTSSTIQVHGDMLGGRGWLREAWGEKGWMFGGGKGGTGRELVSGEGCRSLILLDVDGCSHIV